MGLLDDIDIDELQSFLIYDFWSLRGELSSLLPNRRMIRIGEQLVYSNLEIYARDLTL